MKNQEAANSITPSISKWLKKHVRSFTDYLNKQVNNKSTKAKKIALLLFGLATGIVCLSLIGQSIITTSKPIQDVEKTTSPQDMVPDNKVQDEITSEQEIIRRYNSYIDSLNKSSGSH